MKSLSEMMEEVYEWCLDKWWEPNPNRTFGDETALLHSEVSEAFEAYRDGNMQSYDSYDPHSVAAEFADILIRLLHYSHTHGFDLEAEYEMKMKYNRARPYRHGGKAL